MMWMHSVSIIPKDGLAHQASITQHIVFQCLPRISMLFRLARLNDFAHLRFIYAVVERRIIDFEFGGLRLLKRLFVKLNRQHH
jgi:hypothetical protein